jgi:cytochrome c553
VYESLRAFRERRRFSAVMSEVAARLSDDAMREVATYFEQLPARALNARPDEAPIARGRSIAERGILERDIPACIECHGPTTFPKNPAYPRLASQHGAYLRLQLMLLQEQRRGGTANVNLMQAFVSRLSASEIRDAAAYYSSLSVPTEPRASMGAAKGAPFIVQKP